MEKEEFYVECAKILNLEPSYTNIKQFGRTGRWGPRQPGNGRFEGFGLIRWYSEKLIHVNLYYPKKINKTFSDPELVLKFLKISRLNVT